MKANNNAINEISRLRLYQSSLDNSKYWTWTCIILFFSLFFAPISGDYFLYKLLLQLFLLLIAVLSGCYIMFNGKPTTLLNKKQMALLGISESNIMQNDVKNSSGKNDNKNGQDARNGR